MQDTVAAIKESTEGEGLTLKSVSGAVQGIAGNIKGGLREDGTSTDRRRRRSDPQSNVTYVSLSRCVRQARPCLAQTGAVLVACRCACAQALLTMC